jgi:hypothetical protein
LIKHFQNQQKGNKMAAVGYDNIAIRLGDTGSVEIGYSGGVPAGTLLVETTVKGSFVLPVTEITEDSRVAITLEDRGDVSGSLVPVAWNGVFNSNNVSSTVSLDDVTNLARLQKFGLLFESAIKA